MSNTHQTSPNSQPAKDGLEVLTAAKEGRFNIFLPSKTPVHTVLNSIGITVEMTRGQIIARMSEILLGKKTDKPFFERVDWEYLTLREQVTEKQKKGVVFLHPMTSEHVDEIVFEELLRLCESVRNFCTGRIELNETASPKNSALFHVAVVEN